MSTHVTSPSKKSIFSKSYCFFSHKILIKIYLARQLKSLDKPYYPLVQIKIIKFLQYNHYLVLDRLLLVYKQMNSPQMKCNKYLVLDRLLLVYKQMNSPQMKCNKFHTMRKYFIHITHITLTLSVALRYSQTLNTLALSVALRYSQTTTSI